LGVSKDCGEKYFSKLLNNFEVFCDACSVVDPDLNRIRDFLARSDRGPDPNFLTKKSVCFLQTLKSLKYFKVMFCSNPYVHLKFASYLVGLVLRVRSESGTTYK
jgi:hypothetical protein